VTPAARSASRDQTKLPSVEKTQTFIAITSYWSYYDRMARKPERKPDDPEQSKRFKETAKELEANDKTALGRAFKKIATSKPPKARPDRP